MRDIQSPTGLHYRIHESPEDLALLTPRVAQESEIWFDTETADWNTKSPRLALVQFRLGDGSIHVLDGREHPQVGALRAVRAADPRRRLRPRPPVHLRPRPSRAVLPPPAASLRLAALVHHLCGTAVDKTLQRADWGQRPLSAEQLEYAAWDPEWCYRVHRRLDPLVRSWDPAAIQSRYVEILPAERDAGRWRTAMWDAIKAFMVSGSHEHFAAFLLQTRVVRKVPIRVLAAAVAEVDPMHVAESAVAVPGALLEALRPGARRRCARRDARRSLCAFAVHVPPAPRLASHRTRSIRAIPRVSQRNTPRPGTAIGSSSPSATS
jgi:ribonuclease D